MQPQQIRQEIEQVIARLPVEQLPEVLAYLKQLSKLSPEQQNRVHKFKQILREDANLLSRLAK